MDVNTKLTDQKETSLVVGCGRFGSWLAGTLSAAGCRVIILDQDKKAFELLPDSFGGLTITGNAADVTFLQSLDLSDIFLAVVMTNDDNTNSLIAQIMYQIIKIPKVITRFYDPDSSGLIQNLDIEVISPFQLSIEAFQNMTKEYFIE